MRSTPTAVLVVLLVIGLMATALPSGAAPGQDQGSGQDNGEAGRYIVALDRGDPNEVAAQHSQRHDAEVSHVYTNVLGGYAATMSDRAAERIAGDDRVAYVDRDVEVYTLHHQCAHTGGPPNSGSGDCEISGLVTDAASGEAIGGAAITVETGGEQVAETETGGDGGYAVQVADEETYDVTANADGYEPSSESVTVAGADEEVDFALTAESEPDSGTISGTVVETGDEPAAISDADVTVLDDGAEVTSTTTDSNGDYTTDQVSGGTYDVTASHDDYEDATQEVTVDGDIDGIDFALDDVTAEPPAETRSPGA